ncbi:hypothetical protein [Corallococcus sp. 4LFB]|uniref:hypothetical protein n=1 Tax=Corallococcus sp. 4LFB TaxID=3383249 RepID=UPI00397474CD
MHRLNARHWGLVAIIAAAPFVLAFVLGATAPQLLEPVLGATPVGGLSWGAGHGAGAGGRRPLRAHPRGLQRRASRRPGAAPAGHGGRRQRGGDLCIVPAVALMLVGPSWVLQRHLEVPAAPTVRSLKAGAVDLLGQARRAYPHRLPLSLLLPGPH